VYDLIAHAVLRLIQGLDNKMILKGGNDTTGLLAHNCRTRVFWQGHISEHCSPNAVRSACVFGL
ncbi:MAG: hypothetical protein QMC20_02910, partial [Halioglobus sp.]